MLQILLCLFCSTGDIYAGQSVTPSEDSYALSENPYALNEKTSCGVHCLSFLDQYFGGEHTYAEVVKICPPGPLGLSFQTLEAALQELGYHTRAVHLNSTTFQLLEWPSIIHQVRDDSSEHFLVCLGWQREYNNFTVFNPPGELGEFNAAELDEIISGMVLVVSDEPLPPVEDLIPTAYSWRYYAGMEFVVLGLLLLLCSAIRSTRIRHETNGTVTSTLLLLCFGLSGCEKTNSQPEVKNNQYVIDLGEVSQGSDLQAKFNVVNNTSATFQVRSIERSCRCQSVTFNGERKVAPGESIPIEVTVNAKDLVGGTSHTMLVHTTPATSKENQISLEIKANVTAKIQAIPSHLMFGTIGNTETRQCQIITNPPELSNAYIGTDTSEFITAELVKRTPGNLLFNVTTATDIPSGLFRETLKIHFNLPKTPTFEVKILGTKAGSVNVVPTQLTINTQGARRSLRVRVASTQHEPFRILSVKTPEGIIPSWDKSHKQEAFMVEVLVSNPEHLVDKSIIIQTNIPGEPEVRIPIVVRNGKGM